MADDDAAPGRDSAFDPSLLIDVASGFLFEGGATLTQRQVAERAGVDLDLANALWRYLGFPATGDDEVAFTEADVEAVRTTKRLLDLQVMTPEQLPQFVRSLGRTYARLADWQTRVLLSTLAQSERRGTTDAEPALDVVAEVIPLVEQVQGYVWRRHLLAAASRIALRDVEPDSAEQVVVGFVDIVGYTSRSRQMSTRALGDMVEWFERVTLELVVAHGGQVVKTIGDEALFIVDELVEAARLALELVERAGVDEAFPEVRVGLAYGTVLARVGDVFGSTVNLAARLTSLTRPSRVLVDAALADLLREHDDTLRLRRTRRTSVKGFSSVEPWALTRRRSAEARERS